ncbi:hypothetical protein Gpo141_00003032 [Globisporangium polare]
MGRTCDDMMERMHGYLHLGTRLDDRVEQLNSRFELAIRTATSVTDAITKGVGLDRASPQLVPFSRTSARGLKHHTLISNVFICRIPIHRTSSSRSSCDGLKRVFDAAVASHEIMQSEMSKRLGIHVDTERVHELGGDRRSYVRVTRRDSDFRGSSSNVAFAAELVNDHLAVITTDFTDEDELLDSNNSKSELKIDACSTLTLTRHYDEALKQHYVLLRRLHVFRYNLLSSSALLFRELNRAMPFINGDLPMALLCEAMQTPPAAAPLA